MVNIRPNRMRSITDARNAFSTLVGDAENGLTTHIIKGSTVVAHLVPAAAPVLDDPSLRLAMIAALTASEAAAAGANEWREARLWHAGDTVGRLLAWTWRADSDLCMRAFASFHDHLQRVVGATLSLSAVWPGIEVALGVALDEGETAALFRYLDQHYDDYYLGPYRSAGTV